MKTIHVKLVSSNFRHYDFWTYQWSNLAFIHVRLLTRTKQGFMCATKSALLVSISNKMSVTLKCGCCFLCFHVCQPN